QTPSAAEPTQAPKATSEPSEPSAAGKVDAPSAVPTAVEAEAGAPPATTKAEPAKTDGPEFVSPFGFLYGGHARRWMRGGLTFLFGCLGAFWQMARETQYQWRWGVPVGFIFTLIATIGALDLFGTFDDVVAWVRAPRRIAAGGKPVDSSKPDISYPRPTSLPSANVSATIIEASVATKPFLLTLVSLLTAMTIMGHAVGIGYGIAAAIAWTATCAFGFKTLEALGLTDRARGLTSREGFWLIVFCIVLYVPALGAHSLVDPWETHYGEVSREVLSRDDWITIWWAEEGYFLSKPILDFWMQALAMATFGVAFVADKHTYLPDRVLAPTEIGGEPMHPEWIVRLPSLALSVVALYLAYKAVSKIYGRRAGLLGAMILATMGDWMMLSHQSITDMPFVASLTAAMALLIIGLTTPDDETVDASPVRFGSQVRALSAYHLAIGSVLVLALPQMLYFISRNVTVHRFGGPIFGYGVELHADQFHAGSGHKCWTDPASADSLDAMLRIGKWKCDQYRYAFPMAQPTLLGIIGLVLLAVLLILNRNERRVSRLCFIVAWIFAGISTMGKGIAGFGMPMAVVGAYILASNRWRDVLRLEIVSGVIVMFTVSLPWYFAMYVRMGDEFFQQLIIHHMIKRASDHVHDTNTGDDVSIHYYVWQLGYGMWPWSGLVPAGLVWWARKRWTAFKAGAGEVLGSKTELSLDDQNKRDIATFLIMWFVLAFTLFTKMPTKFHHYIFPAIPPAAMLLGVFLDDAIGPRALLPKSARAQYLAFIGVGVAAMTYGFSKLVPGPLFGHLDFGKELDNVSAVDVTKLVDQHYAASPVVGTILGLAGLALVLFAGKLAGESPEEDDGGDDEGSENQAPNGSIAAPVTKTLAASSKHLFIGALAIMAALTSALVTRDLASRPDADIKGQERLIQLYTYRYDRAWPKDVYFSNVFVGLGIAMLALLLVMAARAYRRQALVAIVALSALTCAWTLDDYMMKVAPHWGQRPLFEAYYRDRRSDKEPLVAFEMNWKGENFYSGGGLVEFGNGMGQGSTSGERASERMREWLSKVKTRATAVYFVTEKNRVNKIEEQLKGVLGAPTSASKKWTEEITKEADDNKFIVVRVRFPT
ncbi:MAG: glycosyltransferase family 39 protein, partial [Polyangiales bacterium]